MANDLPGPDDTLLSQNTREAAITIPDAARRSTVLPRVEWNGPEPRVLPLSRQRFEELGLLGMGGMGEVVLAQDHDIERTVALKRLPPGADLGRVVRFVEEIRTVGQLEHPNIVPVHDVGIDSSGRYYFVMKHLRGETLETIIERLKAGEPAAHAKYTYPVRIQLFLGVLHAMAYAHRQGFIHRDLKPANIMVGPFGEVTVMDWGLAKRIHAAKPEPGATSTPSREGTALQTQLGAVIGTPLYMSPEQARGANDALDERSDLYSLAVIFHELLYLRHYLDGLREIPAILEGVKTKSPELFALTGGHPLAAVPAELTWYLSRGLEKDAAKRYQSIDEMLQGLQRVVSGDFDVQCHRTFAKRLLHAAIHQVDRNPNASLVGAAAVAVVIVAAVVKALLPLFG